MSGAVLVVITFVVVVIVIGLLEWWLGCLFDAKAEPNPKTDRQFLTVWILFVIVGWNSLLLYALLQYGVMSAVVSVLILCAIYQGFKFWINRRPKYERYFFKNNDWEDVGEE